MHESDLLPSYFPPVQFFPLEPLKKNIPGANPGARFWQHISESVTPFALRSAEARGTLPGTPGQSGQTMALSWRFGGVQQEPRQAVQPAQALQVLPRQAQAAEPVLLAQSAPAPLLLQELVRESLRLFQSSL